MRCGNTQERWRGCQPIPSRARRPMRPAGPCEDEPCCRDYPKRDAALIRSLSREARAAVTSCGTRLPRESDSVHQCRDPAALYSFSPCDVRLISQHGKIPQGSSEHEPPCIWVRRRSALLGEHRQGRGRMTFCSCFAFLSCVESGHLPCYQPYWMRVTLG